MTLTERQKDLLFQALESYSRTLYYNSELNRIDYDYKAFTVNTYELNRMFEDYKILEEFIANTLDDLCEY